MKKVTAFALLCVLIFSLFVSCNQPEEPQTTDLDAKTQVILQSEDKVDSAQPEQVPENEPQEQQTEKIEQSVQTKKEESVPQPKAPENPPAQPAGQPEIAEQEPEKNYCTVAIYCDTILDNMETLDVARQAVVPPDGVVLLPAQIEITTGQTVFDALLAATQANGIHMEFSHTPGLDSMYIEGIANFYEFDFGSLSGWLYFVNGEGKGVGADQYKVQSDDEIQWHYTCQMGQDIKIKQ